MSEKTNTLIQVFVNQDSPQNVKASFTKVFFSWLSTEESNDHQLRATAIDHYLQLSRLLDGLGKEVARG